MVPVNTKVDVDYFFKWFAWDDDNHSIGFALTKDSAYIYENDNYKNKPKLVEVIPITSKQRKQIKEYLFNYQDICKNTTQYHNFSTDKYVYNLVGHFKNKLINKRVIGDAASPKIQESIFKILNNEKLKDNDYINCSWK